MLGILGDPFFQDSDCKITLLLNGAFVFADKWFHFIYILFLWNPFFFATAWCFLLAYFGSQFQGSLRVRTLVYVFDCLYIWYLLFLGGSFLLGFSIPWTTIVIFWTDVDSNSWNSFPSETARFFGNVFFLKFYVSFPMVSSMNPDNFVE